MRARLLLGLLLLSSLTTQAANIYVTASGNNAFDENLQRALQSFGHSVTVGVPYSTFDGAQNLSGFDAVYLQVNYNWGANGMPAAGQTALVNFVKAGGGLVTTEWLLWMMGDNGSFAVLNSILPVNPTTTYTGVSAATFAQSAPNPDLNVSLPATFSMNLEDLDGGYTLFPLPRAGASSFYKIDGYVALAGWDVGNGRVLSFATTNGQAQLNNPNFRQLLSNSMDWVEQGQTPVVTQGGVVNAASFARGQPVAPGSLVTIFGSSLASSRVSADTIPLPKALGGVSVTFNDIEAPLQFVSPQQINAQIPWKTASPGATGETVSMVVRRGQNVSQVSAVQIAATAPAIFSLEFGSGQAISTNENGSLSAPSGLIPGISSEPARVGSTIVVLCTGLGAVDPPGRDGQSSADAQRRTLATPIVLIGGVQAQVKFAGLTAQLPGVYQIEVVVPQVTPRDQTPIQIRIGDVTSSDRVTIAVRN